MNLINTLIILSATVFTKVLGVQMCGKALADMLDLICDGRGFHWINQEALPTITKRSAVQYLAGSNTLQRHGVVTECCRKSCTLDTLESYCAAPSGVHYPNPTSGPITEDVANDILESASQNKYPNSLTTAPPATQSPQPTQTTKPVQTFKPTNRWSKLLNVLTKTKSKGLYANLRKTPFFFVRPVGPLATRTPLVA